MINRLPAWFKQEIPGNEALGLSRMFIESGINTVCSQAKCPNITECFKNKRATFMILGNVCTRNCRFCNISKTGTVLKPKLNCPQEPSLISNAVKMLGLEYVVITSVTRDDLDDGGAKIFAKTIELIQALDKNIKVEVLIPDFCGKILSLEKVVKASPQVLAHNIETVKRLYGELRPKADYGISLVILKKAKQLNPGIVTKSSLMLGLGETEDEVREAMRDLREHNCDVLTLGQYLAPSPDHYPVKEFISIAQFHKYRQIGLDLGFKAVFSGPKVRSSYLAEDLYRKIAYV